MQYAFADKEAPLGLSYSNKASKNNDRLMYFQNWRSSINSFIKKANDKYPGVYTSHSFLRFLIEDF